MQLNLFYRLAYAGDRGQIAAHLAMKPTKKTLGEIRLRRAAQSRLNDLYHHLQGTAEKNLGGLRVGHGEAEAADRLGQHPRRKWLAVHQHTVAIEYDQSIAHSANLVHRCRQIQFALLGAPPHI